MSLRLFVYYGGVCGAGCALAGWLLGRVSARGDELLSAALQGMLVGLCLACGLALLDARWHLSLRPVTLTAQRVLSAAVAGAVAGFFGGLFGVAVRAPLLSAALGWTLAGALLGATPGLFDLLLTVGNRRDRGGPLGKVLGGLKGGAVGGLAGGVLGLAVSFALGRLFAEKSPEERWSPGAVRAACLGACVGLAVTVAQVRLGKHRLEVEAGASAGREVLLTRPFLLLGAAEECDLRLEGDPRVARRHARLERQGEDYAIADEESQEGTFVNDERLNGPRLLRSGDRIRVGACVLRFSARTRPA
jgi:hypothetical protein